MDEAPLQEFRVESSSKIISIPTRYDPRTRHHTVLWKDIQQCFENARNIMNNRVAVLFLTDDNFVDLHPLRIAHHPGVVLEVLVSSDHSQSGTSHSRTPSMSQESELSTDHQAALVVRSQDSPSEAQRPLLASSHRFVTYTHEAFTSFQGYVASSSNGHSLMDSSNMVQQEQLLRQQQQQIDKALQEIQETNQRSHQQQQQADDILQKMQETDQQTHLMQQQINQVLRTVQQIDQRTLRSPQKIVEILESNNSQPAFQGGSQVFERLMTIQSRIQALLAASYQDLPSPRLFIVLPRTVNPLAQDEKPAAPQFRLYYLCECGAYTMSEDSGEEHEIHMADHGGYDLENHASFFKQYGSYLLTMMYMVKYGALAAGRVVPQLSGLRLAHRIDESDQDRVEFIDYQVDDMIAYLEQTLSTNHGAMNHSLQWKLDPLEFCQLSSYINVKEGTSVSGNLRPTITQNRHSVWVCSEHQREYHRSTLQQLNEFISTNDGRYSEELGKIRIKIRSAALTKRFLDAMRKVHWIQDFNNQWSLTALDLKLGCRCSATMSAARILINLDTVESLIVDFGRFVLSAGIPQDGVRYMEIEMGQLGELTLDDMTSIPQCHFKQFTIKYTPQKADEDRLVTILEHSPKLEVLRIGCLAERVHAIISLVISTREKALDKGVSPPLRTLEVMDEGLVPFDVDRPNDTRDHVESTITFSRNSKAFEMQTYVKLRKGKAITEDDPMCGLFKEYGWSFETLDAPSSFSNSLAACLHEGTRERGSRIAFLSITPTSLITSGLEALHQIITISPCSEYLRLPLNHLEQTYQLDKALLLLGRYRDRLNNLGLYGNSIARWLPQIMRTFPTRESFPKLTVLGMGNYSISDMPPECIRWIVSMVSAPPPSPPSSSSIPSRSPSPLVRLSSDPGRITRLERFTLADVALRAEDWACVIEAMDLRALEKLNLKDTNFSHRELELLIHRLVDNKDSATMPLRSLCLGGHLFENDAARELRTKLREKAPQIKIR